MAGGGGSSGDPNADKNSLAILWGVAAIFVVVTLIWHFFGYYLKVFFLKIRLFEAQLISYFVDEGEYIAQLVINTDVDTLNLAWAGYLSHLVGEYLRYPLGIALLFMMINLFFAHANLKFNKIYDMTRLVDQEQGNWPQIAPVVKLDLTKEDISKGPWAMAMTPMNFAKKYKLITVEMVPDKKSPWKAEGMYKPVVDEEKARRLFINQLGPLWEGIDKLPPYAMALFAIFAARVEHDTQGPAALTEQLAISAARGKLDFTGVSKLLRQHVKSKAVQRCVSRHGYVYTVMASMLELARTDGVLASADFLWLKPIDRRLWYMLNCVGRQVVYPEVAGPFAHWLTEKEVGRPLSVPVIEAAVSGLEVAMERSIYVADDDEEIPLVGEQSG